MHLNFIQFVENTNELSNKASIVYIKSNKSKEELLSTFKDRFKFPEYFGMNWDALFDSLRNSEWLREHQITVVHEGILSGLTSADFKAYLQVLADICSEYPELKIKVIFPENTKKHMQGV